MAVTSHPITIHYWTSPSHSGGGAARGLEDRKAGVMGLSESLLNICGYTFLPQSLFWFN